MIDVCKDYEQCPWDELETLPSQDFFDPKASQSVVTRAKETYFALHGEGSQTIDACFTSLVLSMKKKMQNCNTLFPKYKEAMHELSEKSSSMTEFSETDGGTFSVGIWNQIGGASKVSWEDFDGCLKYKVTSSDARNQLFTTLTTVDPISKLAFKIVSSTISIFGLLGNLALFAIYIKKDCKVRFNNLMLLIISFDFFFIICGVVKGSMIESSVDITIGKMVNFLFAWWR